jgi:N-acetylmuramoyl-L-alanine amidase
MAKGTVVIDPGHGGTLKVGGSSANNAASPSGVLEKTLTLQLGLLVREALQTAAHAGGHTVKVVMTRETDQNLGLADRAAVAKQNRANSFLSIHFNASEGHNARGVETLIRPTAAGNTNHAEDKAFAQRIQNAVFTAIQAHDPNTKDRGVKDQVLGVLKDTHLGDNVRACLLEVEFIDVRAVDDLLNLSPNATQVRRDIATAVAGALLEDLQAQEA